MFTKGNCAIYINKNLEVYKTILVYLFCGQTYQNLRKNFKKPIINNHQNICHMVRENLGPSPELYIWN